MKNEFIENKNNSSNNKRRRRRRGEEGWRTTLCRHVLNDRRLKGGIGWDNWPVSYEGNPMRDVIQKTGFLCETNNTGGFVVSERPLLNKRWTEVIHFKFIFIFCVITYVYFNGSRWTTRLCRSAELEFSCSFANPAQIVEISPIRLPMTALEPPASATRVAWLAKWFRRIGQVWNTVFRRKIGGSREESSLGGRDRVQTRGRLMSISEDAINLIIFVAYGTGTLHNDLFKLIPSDITGISWSQQSGIKVQASLNFLSRRVISHGMASSEAW